MMMMNSILDSTVIRLLKKVETVQLCHRIRMDYKIPFRFNLCNPILSTTCSNPFCLIPATDLRDHFLPLKGSKFLGL